MTRGNVEDVLEAHRIPTVARLSDNSRGLSYPADEDGAGAGHPAAGMGRG